MDQQKPPYLTKEELERLKSIVSNIYDEGRESGYNDYLCWTIDDILEEIELNYTK